MHTITREFGPYPAAHRHHRDDGIGSLIHGHNWNFEIILAAVKLDKNDIVYSFEKMTAIREYLKAHFDHTLLLDEADPMRIPLQNVLMINPARAGEPRLANVIPCMHGVSSEGLAKKVFIFVDQWISIATHERVHCHAVVCYEDKKSSTRYEGG